jgi:ribonuclease HI
MDQVLDDLVARELQLLGPATRADPEAVERLLHPDFREFGATGGVWDRDAVVAALAADPGAGPEVASMEGRWVADRAVLLTYEITSPARSLRSSLWVQDADEWRLLFHQGTPAAG